MKRAALALTFILALLVSTMVGVHFGTAQNGTNVSGVIGSDTIWEQANSPYTLTGNVLVNNGVTLTIQAGTTVNFEGFYIEVNGTLQAAGTNVYPILFNGEGGQAEITFDQSAGAGSIIQNAILNFTELDVEGVTSPSICYNLFIDSPIFLEGYFVTGDENAVSMVFCNNTLINGGISIHDISFPSPTIQYNNFIGAPNDWSYYGTYYWIYLSPPTADVTASYNWWGTTNVQAINQTIYDFKDNFDVGTVAFAPILTSPNNEAPIYINATAGAGGSISPNGIISLNYGGSQTFTITPNDGYYISNVLVDGTSVGAVSSYNVQNAEGAIIISATFAPNSTPTPSPSPSSTPSLTATPTPSSTATPTPSSPPTATPSPALRPSPTTTPSPTPKPSSAATPSHTPNLSPTGTPSSSPAGTSTLLPTPNQQQSSYGKGSSGSENAAESSILTAAKIVAVSLAVGWAIVIPVLVYRRQRQRREIIVQA